MSPVRSWLAASLLAGVFCFTGLGNHPLRAADEPRVAGVGWETAHGRDFVVPRLAGEPFIEHPPLGYAALATSFSLFGVSETSARLPAAIASFLTLLLVFDTTRRIAGPRAGLVAVAALCATRGFFRYSHKVIVDPWLALFVMAGYACYVQAAFGRDRTSGRWIFGIHVAAALAFQIKGVPGLVLIGGPIALDVLIFRRLALLLHPAHVPGAIVLALGCAAWPFALWNRDPELFDYWWLQNVVYRIAPTADYVGGHQEPAWYYLLKLPEQITWLLPLLPALGLWLWRGRLPEGWRCDALRFTALVLPLGFLLLSLAGTKRSLYLLPLLPPLAVAMGALLAARPFASRRVGAFVAPWLAYAAWTVAVAWNLVVYPTTGADRDLEPLAQEVAARFGPDAPVVGYRVFYELQGALPFYTGRVLRNLDDPDALRAHARAHPGGLLIQGNHPLPGFPADFGDLLRPVAHWDMTEGAYTLYALGGEP